MDFVSCLGIISAVSTTCHQCANSHCAPVYAPVYAHMRVTPLQPVLGDITNAMPMSCCGLLLGIFCPDLWEA